MPRRISWLPWVFIAAAILVFACELPSTRVPVATRVVVIETPLELAEATETMRRQGCVLAHLIADPAGPGTWAVFSCITIPMESLPVQATKL